MSTLDSIAARWSAAFARVDRETLVELAEALLGDLHATLGEISRLRFVIVTGGAMYRAERAALGVPGGVDEFNAELDRLREIELIIRAAGEAEDADDLAFDAASDALWAKARELAGNPPREGVSEMTDPRRAPTKPAPPASVGACACGHASEHHAQWNGDCALPKCPCLEYSP